MNKWIDKKASDPVKFKYKNHRGEVAIRSVHFGTMIFGNSTHHKEPQWFLRGWCTDRKAVRWFALRDCDFTTTELPSEVTTFDGSPDPKDPDNYWIDDATGERVNAKTGERTKS